MRNPESIFRPEFEHCVETYQLKGEIMHNQYLTPTSKLIYCYIQTHIKDNKFNILDCKIMLELNIKRENYNSALTQLTDFEYLVWGTTMEDQEFVWLKSYFDYNLKK